MSTLTNRQYPPQTGFYKVDVKRNAGWHNHNIARLAISVGQANHEEQRMEATCLWARDRFKYVIIDVNDTLQRYNFMAEGMNEAEAHAKALEEGDKWIKRNQPFVDLLSNYEIQRWDKWLTDPRFQKAHTEAINLYNTHNGFKTDIDQTAWSFINRRDDIDDAKRQRLMGFSIEFLIEETAVFALQERDCITASIYPGSLMRIFDRFAVEDIPDAPEGLERRQFTQIDFLRNKNYQPKVA